MKLYQNGDCCPCCGTVITNKTRQWLMEFSILVNDLGLPDWPNLQESWDADTMIEQKPK